MQNLTVDAAVESLDRASIWVPVGEVPLDFACHHPQGLARVGANFYLSAVEVLEPTARYATPIGGHDRSPGRGRGHLFEMTAAGRLLRHWELGEGDAYHPGGIGYDGRDIWIPVGEYRPHSSAIMYRLDPRTGQISREFEHDDHLSGVACDPETGRLHAITWGSRKVVEFTRTGRKLGEHLVRSHYVDFQDCLEVCGGSILWTGVAEYPHAATGAVFQLGGIAIADLRTGQIRHEVPITVTSRSGRVITFNATHLDLVDDRLRLIAIPDDGDRPGVSQIITYETVVKV
jgi:hypothetical protein